MPVSGLGGNKLDKHIGIYDTSVDIKDGQVSGSYSWKCTKGNSGEEIDFPTCDDCIDFLVIGCDEVAKHINYILIPPIGQTGKDVNFSFSIADISEPENIWIVLAQVYNESQAREAYKACVSDPECGMKGLLGKVTVTPPPSEKVDPLEELITFIEGKRPEIPVESVQEAVAKAASTVLKAAPKFRVFPSILTKIKI